MNTVRVLSRPHTLASLALAICVATAPAFADDDAPPPHDAAGYLVPPRPARDGWRIVPRVVLMPLRWTWKLFGATSGIAVDWFQPAFARAGGTSGAVHIDKTGPTGGPIVHYESEYGTTLGARGGYTAALGKAELGAAAGGRYEYGFDLDLALQDRGSLSARYVSYDEERFYGMTSAGEMDPGALTFEQRTASATARARFDLSRRFIASPSATVSSHRFDTPAELAGVAGFDGGVDEAYAEVALTYHSLRVSHDWISRAVPSSGWFVKGRAGGALGIGEGEVEYARTGIEVVRLFDLYGGDRVLVLGQRIEAVIGDRTQVPYIDLPALGGPFGLRGYPRYRFRDRIAAEATAEYRYGLHPNLTARTFVDVGRTFPAIDELSVDDLRAGFGGGLLVHHGDSVSARFDVAGSIDGDLFVLLSWGAAP